ncbi:hypothetical protein JVT61DRAFT_2194 [Boletus reticuloceps]|uniref:FAD/NAD(P)-binding domain-containing protein n=1 Tax=Boletus reticuloceps TaxID=495285 RepID=A0A8I2YNZ0_9AGAM|nr:hypothetical protein JVT61DRAFT_2194 [Boletus reticuloceps]
MSIPNIVFPIRLLERNRLRVTLQSRRGSNDLGLPGLNRCPAPPTDDPPLTPLYDSLTTNLPHPVMESYASHFNLIPLIRFNVTVTHATWIRNHWRVTISTGETLEFDNLVVANGHYRLPNVPDIPGLDHWITTNMASHSAWYRRPLEFGRKILVVGGGPSGKDIAAEMRNHVRTVIHSVSGSVSRDDGHFKQRGRPLRFYDDGRVLFEQGIIEENIDHCILATGFQRTSPFSMTTRLESAMFPFIHPSHPISTIPSHYPVCSVAFMTLLYKVVPFPIAEAQARAIVRAFADPASLDLEQEADRVLSRSRALIAAGASSPVQLAKAWFRFRQAEQWDYRDELFAYAAESGDCPATKVAAWEKEMYANKNVLRTAWVELEKENESQRWVEGIGEGGIQEWVEMMYRLLRHARDSEELGEQRREFNEPSRQRSKA